MSMGTVEAAAKHSMQLVAAALIGVVVGNIVMSGVEKVAGGQLADEARSGRLNLPAAVLASVLHPAQVRAAARHSLFLPGLHRATLHRATCHACTDCGLAGAVAEQAAAAQHRGTNPCCPATPASPHAALGALQPHPARRRYCLTTAWHTL